MIHLHVHTPYSLLDGFGQSEDYIARAIELNQSAVAITDHGVVYGIYEHYKACLKANIKPILGCEFYVTPDISIKEKKQLDELPFDNCHLVLLAKNNIGLANLFELASIAQLDGFYYKPRVDKSILARYSEGLIALSGCLAGDIPQLILRGEMDQIEPVIAEYKQIFPDFYLEVQANTIPEQALVNSKIYQLAEQTNTPIVVTCDCHYVKQEDGLYHKNFVKLGGDDKNNTWDEKWTSIYTDAWMKSETDILAMGIPQIAIDNTHTIADMCAVTIETGTFHMPEFNIPVDFTLDSYLTYLAYNGLFTLTLDEDIDTLKYVERLTYELEIITSKGYSGYFLIVRDLINEASSRALVGPGRGSAAGCLVSYLIGITKIDPIKHNLLFERFLNPERPTAPDIDIDVDSNIRQDLIDYVCDKYGADNVCQIITFGTLQSKLALKDAGRILNVDFTTVNNLTKSLPNPPQDGTKYTLEDAIAQIPSIAQAYEEHREMFEIAMHFEGIPRNVGMHAAGIVIAPDKLTKFIPLGRGKDKGVVSQFPKDTLEELGLLKIDLLALKTLPVIKSALELIQREHGVTINIDKVSFDDRATLDLISSGHTIGVFQLESTGMQHLFRSINRVTFDTLVAGVALYRPGPMAQIPRYIASANGYAPISYIVPELEPILRDTYGIIVYQEQTMRIATDLAGFTPGQSDLLRKAIGKKKASVMEPELEKLLNGNVADNIPGMVNLGIPRDKAEELVTMIRTFASYGFNKSHACCYAALAFQTAYLKAHYPAEYMCALLNVYHSDKDIFPVYLEEARRLGVVILPPDINTSQVNFDVVHNCILYGLCPIKGMGENSSALLVDSRPFLSVDQLATLPKKDVNKKVLYSLCFSGALDGLGESRIEIFNELMGLRGDKADPLEFDDRIRYTMECDLLKIPLSSHPLRNIAKTVDWSAIDRTRDVELYCIIKQVKKRKTRDDRDMCYLIVDTLEGTRELIVFPFVYQSLPEVKQEQIVKVKISKWQEAYTVKELKISKKYNKKG